MAPIYLFFSAAAGIAIGFTIAQIIFKRRGDQLSIIQEKLKNQSAQSESLQNRLTETESLYNQERTRNSDLQARAASLEAISQRVPQVEKELQLSRDEAKSLLQNITSLEKKVSELTTNTSQAEKRVEEFRNELTQRQTRIEELTKDLSQTQSRFAQLETLAQQERKQAAEKLAYLNEAREQLKADFRNLANNILEENSSKFTEQNRANLDILVNPLREQISEFKKRIEDVYDKESKERVSLFVEITNLKQLNQKISEDAVNLANALKGDNKTQGNWGQLALERVLEMSGLQKGREYEIQVHTHDLDGNRFLPDVIVRLPEGKDVIIDSKVSLTAYEKFYSAQSDEDRQSALNSHILSVRNHIRDLSGKNYDQLQEVRSLDYVLLFIPIESAFLAAIKEDSTLFSDAFSKNIILVCPSTLLVTLRTIANIWRYEYQNQNAMTIAKKAADLYDKFVSFTETLAGVSETIKKASDKCDYAMKLLCTGKGNLVRRAEEFRLMGVKGKKNLSREIVDSSETALLIEEQ